MKDFLKTKWQIILPIILLVFGLSKCTQSCNRAAQIDVLNSKCVSNDSMIVKLNDSITQLNHQIELLTNDKNSRDEIVAVQKEAIEKINEAKKNINVTVRK